MIKGCCLASLLCVIFSEGTREHKDRLEKNSFYKHLQKSQKIANIAYC